VRAVCCRELAVLTSFGFIAFTFSTFSGSPYTFVRTKLLFMHITSCTASHLISLLGMREQNSLYICVVTVLVFEKIILAGIPNWTPHFENSGGCVSVAL
jgi:hypothetical protein